MDVILTDPFEKPFAIRIRVKYGPLKKNMHLLTEEVFELSREKFDEMYERIDKDAANEDIKQLWQPTYSDIDTNKTKKPPIAPGPRL